MNKFNQDRWMMFEDDIIKYYYPMLKEWLDNGMKKPASIQFTSGLCRDIARLMEDAVRNKEEETQKKVNALVEDIYENKEEQHICNNIHPHSPNECKGYDRDIIDLNKAKDLIKKQFNKEVKDNG